MRYLEGVAPRAKRNAALAITLALAASLSGMGCRGGGEEKKEASAAKPAEGAKPAALNLATQVSVTEVKPSSIADTAQVSGSLSSMTDLMVSVKNSGKLQAVFVREGDVVHVGQAIAQQDPVDLQAQLDSQRANLSAMQSRLEQARVIYRNATATLKWTDEQTQASVKQAQAALEIAKQQQAVTQQGARQQEKQQAEENVTAAKAERDRARADLKRYRELFREQAISAQQLDQAQSVADASEARYNSAAQALSLVREGSRPEDIRRAQAAVDQANQALAAAQSNRAQVNLRRIDVDNARAAIATAEAGVRQAKSGVDLAAQAMKDLTLRSPIEGMVASRLAEPGMQVGNVKPEVVRIVDLNNMYFDAVVPEVQYSRIRLGLPVEVSVYALPGRTFSGTIAKVFPIATAARTFTVRVNLKNTNNVLRPQMFATGMVVFRTRANVLVVSRDAVLDRTRGAGRVFVVENGIAQERTVSTGIQSGDKIEVTEGLTLGEKLVTTGQGQIRKGDKVEIIAGETKPTL